MKKLKPVVVVQEDKPTESLSLRIRHALERQGFKVYRVNNGATAGKRRANVYDKGLPDFIANNGKRVLFIESKDSGDTLKPEQKFFLEQSDNCISFSTVCWNKKDTDFQDFEQWVKLHK